VIDRVQTEADRVELFGVRQRKWKPHYHSRFLVQKMRKWPSLTFSVKITKQNRRSQQFQK